jgi:hypothetical protein
MVHRFHCIFNVIADRVNSVTVMCNLGFLDALKCLIAFHVFLHYKKGNYGQTAKRERVTLRPNAVGPLPSAYRSPGPSM